MCDEINCVCEKCGGCTCRHPKVKCLTAGKSCCCKRKVKFGSKSRIRLLEKEVDDLRETVNRLEVNLSDTHYWAMSAHSIVDLLCKAMACSPAKAKEMAKTLRDNTEKLNADHFRNIKKMRDRL